MNEFPGKTYLTQKLRDASVRELILELESRVSWLVLCCENPANDKSYSTCLKGSFIEQQGAVAELKRILDFYSLERFSEEEENPLDFLSESE